MIRVLELEVGICLLPPLGRGLQGGHPLREPRLKALSPVRGQFVHGRKVKQQRMGRTARVHKPFQDISPLERSLVISQAGHSGRQGRIDLGR